jgi:hypothetical protein
MTETFEAKLLPTFIKLLVIALHGVLLLIYLSRSLAVQDFKTNQEISTFIKEENENI